MVHTSDAEKKILVREGILFLCQWAVLCGILMLVLAGGEHSLQALVSAHAQLGLRVVGTHTSPLSPVQFWAENKAVEISPLCSGLVEMILLASAIAATPGFSWRKKIVGIAAGVALLYLFNIFRIIITVQQLIHSPLSFAAFTHDVLFRIVLLAGFALLYGGWVNGSRLRAWARARQLL